MLRGRVGRGDFPPSEQLQVVNVASSATADHGCVANHWNLPDLQRVLQMNEISMSVPTIWRILEAADLKPHLSEYWLNSHDPDFDVKSLKILQLYLRAMSLSQQGEIIISTDEKTSMQILERKHPTKLAKPGHRTKREHQYIRHGTRALIASFVVHSGKIHYNIGQTRTNVDFAAHVAQTAAELGDWLKYHWIFDNLNTHCSLEVCEVFARLNGLPFCPEKLSTMIDRIAYLTDETHKHSVCFTPIHGSWLNQVELWFSVFDRRFLRQGDFASAEEFIARFIAFMEDYNTRCAHPYRWTYTGEPLVRATPFSQTDRQRRHSRAWLSSRPQKFDRALMPTRPYRRNDELEVHKDL